jgi:ferredoxin/flavodoxin
MIMKAEIYYFSGTGNSLYIAKDIAVQTGAALFPIASLLDQPTITSGADVIGIVFPVYYVDLPVIVKEFAGKLKNISAKYIFAIATYGGGAGESLHNLSRIIQSHGGKLAAGFGVHMPQNAFRKPWDDPQKIFRHWPKKRERIVHWINLRKSGRSLTDSLLYFIFTPLCALLKRMCKQSFIKHSGAPSDLSLDELIRLNDRSFHTNAQCNGCGICSQVCPVGNIEIKEKRPTWQNRCENCLACYNYCPRRAIEGNVTQKGYFYRHPEVKISEIINQKGNVNP